MQPVKIIFFAIALGLVSCKIENQTIRKADSKSASREEKGSPQSKPQDQVLKFALKCGKDSLRFFYDDSSDGVTSISHILHDEIPYPHGYFIERKFYEGGDWLFISKRTCADSRLFGPIALNPSGSKFASVGQDNVMETGENGVQIISNPLDYDFIQIELEDRISIGDGSQYGPSEWRWINDSVFVVSLLDVHDNKLVREYRSENGMWTIKNIAR